MLAGEQRGVVVRVADGPFHLARVDVVAEHEPLEARELVADGGRGRGRGERDALAGGRRWPAVERLERHQRRLRRDVDVCADQHLAHAPMEGCGQRGLHLHRLDDRHDVALVDLVADRDRDRHDDRRGEIAHETPVVEGHPVRDAVDLDKHVRVLDRGERAVRATSYLEAVLATSELLDQDLDRRAVDRHAIAVRRDLRDDEAIGLPPVAKLDRVREIGAGLRAPAARERVEACPLHSRLAVGHADRGLHQRDVGVAHRDDLTAELQAVEPCRVDVSRADLGTVEQLEQKALVGRATVDDHHRLGQRSAQTREGFVAVAARGDDLGDRRVELGGDDVAFGDAGVYAHARTVGQAQKRDPAWRGYEAQRRVLGVQARLDGVARRRRRLAFQPPAGRDVELELDEVEAGDRLGDRVLDLQRRVDLHERERPGRRLVEELDRAGVAVAGAHGQAPRRLQDLALLLGRERRAGGLLDDLLAAALVRAVAQADRPRAAVPVSDDLHLDVARRRHEPLEQHCAIAEGLLGLGLRARRTRPRASRARRRAGGRARRPPPSP